MASAVFSFILVGCSSAQSTTAPTAAAPAQTPSTAPAAPKSTQERVDDAVSRLLKAAEKAAEKQAQQQQQSLIVSEDIEVVAVASAYAEVNGYAQLDAAAVVVAAAPEVLAKADPIVAPQAAVVLRDTHNSWVAAQVGAEGRAALSNPNWVGATWELSQVDAARAKRSLWLQLELERIAAEEENPGMMRRISNWWNRP